MRAIDGDALLKRVRQEEIQAQVHGREFSTCFMSPGGTPSTEWWFVEDLIENSPTIEPEPCEDAVNMADVIKEISESVCDLEYNCDNRALCEVIKALPSVTPKWKKGKWICISDGVFEIVKCDQCGQTLDSANNFCPRCGAEMSESLKRNH